MITKIKDFWMFIASLPPYKALVVFMGMMITAFGYYYIETEKNKKAEMQVLRSQVSECTEITKQLEDLKRDFILLKATQDYLPVPFWIKSTSGKMLYINDAYKKKYLDPKGIAVTDYIGSFDNLIWEPSESSRFKANDEYVITSNRPHVFLELVNGTSVRVLKYPYSMGDFTVGVAGIEYVNFQ
jgi:hypothetical protein